MLQHSTVMYSFSYTNRLQLAAEYCSVYEKHFETSKILSDVYMLSGGHSYKLWWTFSILLGIFSVFLSDIMSDVLG